MSKFEKLTDTLYRMVLPYKNIYTTVYLLDSGHGYILFDAATTEEDFRLIREGVSRLGIGEDEILYIFISHHHRDHSWGLRGLGDAFANAVLVTRSEDLAEIYRSERTVISPEGGDALLDTYRVIPIVGHTRDSAALFDIRSATLISGDSLQTYGIKGSQDWAANIRFVNEYLTAIDELSKIGINSIYTAHDFYPYGYSAVQRAEVPRYLNACREPIMKIWRLIEENPKHDDFKIREIYNESGDIPTVGERVVAAVRAAFCK